ncbi:DUF1876 domain-containing protein [Nocardioides ungokensis]|uniref:DUF1876 domain-containing protein n=1 Tax=Nocardioides ungokensis TaxID=1643322 RepID=UPI0015DF0DA3|nr:DUF1876 domain-containing protein [Nocardioides ungokensis]
MHTRTWTVEIFIGEKDGRTHAEARLHSEKSARQLTGEGTARRNPTDSDVPEIGDELATARALSDLAHQLLDAAADDIGAITKEHVHLYR